MNRRQEFDTTHWPRRDAYRLFSTFDKPYFNICTRLDVTRLKAAVAAAGPVGGGFSLACSYIALRLANEQEPFRLRLEGGRVWLHDVVDGSTTVLRPDDSFGFATLRYSPLYERFVADGAAAVADARSRASAFDAGFDEQAVIHLTTLPWIHFSSFSHARNWGREDAIPKLAFGRLEGDDRGDRDRDRNGDGVSRGGGAGRRLWMPLSVDVHHALMDGLHVGRYVQAFEAALGDPVAFLGL